MVSFLVLRQSAAAHPSGVAKLWLDKKRAPTQLVLRQVESLQHQATDLQQFLLAFRYERIEQKPRQVVSQPLLDEESRDPQALAGPNDLVGDEALAIVLTEGANWLLVKDAAGYEHQSRTGQL